MKNYREEIKETELKLKTLRKKQKELIRKIKSTNKTSYNREESFNKGDIVVFNGNGLMIARIDKRKDIHGKRGYSINENIHFNHSVIREATKDEIKILGSKKYTILKD